MQSNPQGGIFYSGHCLELLVYGANKNRLTFRFHYFLQSLLTMHLLITCTWGGPFQSLCLGMPVCVCKEGVWKERLCMSVSVSVSVCLYIFSCQDDTEHTVNRGHAQEWNWKMESKQHKLFCTRGQFLNENISFYNVVLISNEKKRVKKSSVQKKVVNVLACSIQFGVLNILNIPWVIQCSHQIKQNILVHLCSNTQPSAQHITDIQ